VRQITAFLPVSELEEAWRMKNQDEMERAEFPRFSEVLEIPELVTTNPPHPSL
jgi:hypothetical protein